jgi:hypothetical protein
MVLVTLNLKPTDKQLRGFGYTALIMCNVISLLLMWVKDLPFYGFIVFCIIGITIYLLSRISLKLIRPIYAGLYVITFPVGRIVGHTMMALFYYVIIGSIGLLFKLLKHDPLHLKYDPDAKSYWKLYKYKRTAEDYFHQF